MTCLSKLLGAAALLASLGVGAAGCATGGAAGPAATEAPQEPARRVVLGPKVSKSRGEEGGIVLLWPRIIPSASADALRPQAKGLQDRLLELVRATYPDRPVDVRPEPERVCPRSGCVGAAVGVLLLTQGGGCAAVVQVSPPGQSPAEQMIWAGVMRSSLEVPFREPPENYAKIQDFVRCSDLLDTTKEREARVLEALEVAR